MRSPGIVDGELIDRWQRVLEYEIYGAYEANPNT